MKIVVLAGGISTERDVSLITGRMIYKALKENKHDCVLLDVYLGYELTDEEAKKPLSELFTLDKDWAKDIKAISKDEPDIEKVKALRPDGDKNFFGPNVIRLCQEADVVFMALHGESGENGKIQACFDLMGIKYTGTDSLSSALAMNKALAKDVFRAHNIPTPKSYRISRSKCDKNNIKPEFLPAVVKVCSGGSSVGVYMANSEEEFISSVKEAFKLDEEVLVEEYIKGREFSIGILENKALPIIEIAPKEGFYDYKNKYQPGATVDTCPAEIPDSLTKAMQDCALDAFKALRLSGYARFDFMMDEKTNKFYVLEGNTLPGMTPTSLVPQEALAIGVSFNELCEKILKTADK